LIDREFAAALPLDRVADHVGLSSRHVSRIVHRETGSTVHAWVVHRRLTEARRCLASTNMTVESIAYRAGFSDESHLRRVFRREHGVTPGAWRASRVSTRGVRPGA
jgi:AraC-like DNA-binding protein